MSIRTFVPDDTALPQAGFEAPFLLSQRVQEKGYRLTIPQNAGELHAIAEKHENALAYYVRQIIDRKEVIFCLMDNVCSESFTFHMSSNEHSDRKDRFYHAVGFRNISAHDDVKEIANLVAETILPSLIAHMNSRPPVER